MSKTFKFLRKDLRDFLSGYDEVLSSRGDHVLFYISFVVSLISVFILSNQKVEWVPRMKSYIFVATVSILGLRHLVTRSIKIWYIVSGFVVVGYVALTRRIDAVAEFVLLSWMIFTFRLRINVSPTIKQVKWMGWITCAIIGVNFYFFDKYGRESIGGLDPNYSSLLIYIALLFATFSKSIVLHALLTILGALTLSRAFILAMIAYYASLLIMTYFPILRLSFKRLMMVIIGSFLLLISWNFMNMNKKLKAHEPSVEGIDRILQYNSRSDFHRWQANITYIQKTLQKAYLRNFGYTPQDYRRRVSTISPHNIFLLEFATHGIFIGILFLAIFFNLLGSLYKSEFGPFFMGMLVFWLVLGVEIGAVYNVFLINMILFLRGSGGHS